MSSLDLQNKTVSDKKMNNRSEISAKNTLGIPNITYTSKNHVA